MNNDSYCNACICGNDHNGNGTLDANEYKDMVGDATGMPTFQELDKNGDKAIDADEITGYPGCEV